MRLNPSNGKAALGISTNLSVDGVVPAPLVGIGAQLPRWFDAAGNVLVYANTTTTEIQSIDLDTNVVTVLLAGGASRLGAGNSVWVRSRNLTGVDGSSFADFGPFPEAGLADVDEDGRFALVQNFAGDRGIVLYDAAATRVFAFDEPISPSAVPRARTNILAYAKAGALWSLVSLVDGSLVAFAPRIDGVVETIPLELASGVVVVIERTSADTLTIRQATTGQGYVLSSTIVYNPDAIELSPGVIRIGWSATEGEGPTALRMIDLNLNTGGNTLWTTASGSLVSSTGTTLSSKPFSVGPIVGGTGSGIPKPIPRHPLTDRQGLVTTPWHQFFESVSNRAFAAVDLSSGVTGTLPPDNGGTGGNTGTGVINASNVTEGTLPQLVKWTQYDTSSTGTQNNFYYNAADAIRANNASALTLTGLVAGVPGQRLVIVAINAAVTLAYESASSTAANRILTADAANLVLEAGEGALLSYDGTSDRWRVLFTTGATDVSGAGYWSPLCAGEALYLPTIVEAAGVWANVTNGDPVSPEITFDSNGDVVMAFTPGDGPYLPPIVTSEDSTIAVWQPTP